MAAHKRSRRAASVISFIVASLLALTAAPANAANLTPSPSPGAVDPHATPAAQFTVAQATTTAFSTFVDVLPSTPLSTEITWMGTSGVVKTGGTFLPAGPTTRTEMAVWAYRVTGSPDYTAPAVTPFKDLATTAAGYKEVSWANSQGFLNAAQDKTYRPAAALTREDMAVALYRLAGKPGFTPPTVSPFKDVAKTTASYTEITWAASLGLAGGYPDGTYKPTIPARHDEVAYAYNRFVGRMQNVPSAGASLNVGPIGTGHTSALVRISVVSAPADTTLNAGGAPVLTVKAKASGSTTVLVPLTANTIPVSASTAIGVTVETLATFDGTATTPGSTIALPPVTRADTVKKLAGDVLSTAPISVGLTGAGGVPSTGVRAVYSTATVTVPSARTLTLGDQKFAVPAGTSSTTTVLVPKDDGTANASIDSGTGTLRLDVRGYVPESSQNANSVNVGGSFIPAVRPSAQTVQVFGPGKASVTIPGVKDRTYALAMVSTTSSPSPSTVPGYLTLGGAPISGHGALVDPATGGQSQLVIVPAGTTATPISVSAGTTKATIFPVGDILSPTARDTDSAPSLTITSPTNGSTVDLSKTGTVKLVGDTTGGSLSTSAVTVSVAGKAIGSAVVRQTAAGASWSFETRIAKFGSPKFDVKVTDRSGRTGFASVTVKATAPDATATLVTPDAVVLDPTKPSQSPAAISPTTVTFSQAPDLQPGKVIVAQGTAANPSGMLRRVTQVNKTSSGWVATTVQAQITDVISQSNIDKIVPVNNLSQKSVNTNVQPGTGDTPATSIAGPVQPVMISATPATASGMQRLLTQSLGLDTSARQSIAIKAGVAFKKGFPAPLPEDFSNAALADASKIKSDAKASLGASLEGSAELQVAVRFVLKITPTFDWGIPNVKIDEFSVVLTTLGKGQTVVTVNGEIDASFKRRIADIEFPPMTIPAGPVPVVITSDMEINIEAKIAGNMSISAQFGGTTKQDFGFKYTDAGGLVDATSTPEEKSLPSSFTPSGLDAIDGKLEGSIGPSIGFSMELWGVAGPKFTAGFLIGGEAKTNLLKTPMTLEYTPYIEGSVKVGVEFTVPIINQSVLSATLASLTFRRNLADPTALDYQTLFPNNPVPAKPVDKLTVAAGYLNDGHALMPDGTVQSWGADDYGQMGDGVGWSPSATAKTVAGLKGVKSISTGSSAVFAVMNDGTVQGWGEGIQNQFADGYITTDREFPSVVKGLSDIASVTVTNGGSMYAVKNDGSVLAWGDNRSGQLIPGGPTTIDTPTKISALSKIKTVAAGNGFALALDQDGHVWTWGGNGQGVSGTGTIGSTEKNAPQRLGLANVVSIAAGSSSAHAVDSAGNVWSWGGGYYGQMGAPGTMSGGSLNVNNGTYSSPVKAQGITNAKQVFATGETVYAIDANGNVWAWGSNYGGQLGDPNFRPSKYGEQVRDTPTLISGLSNVSSMACAGYAGYAVKNDGTVWAWGSADSGGLGDGNRAYHRTNVPVQVQLVK
jgi:alpha-tubulin suppressor-like RCC1 family protein